MLAIIYYSILLRSNWKEAVVAKKLYRSRDERMIWGICGGLAEYFNIDPTLVRVIAVVSLFVGSAGFWAYIIMRFMVPEKS